MHILVVEDEVALCDTIVRSLKRFNTVGFFYLQTLQTGEAERDI